MKISLNSILITLTIFIFGYFILADKSLSYLNGFDFQIYFLILITLGSLLINILLKNIFLEVINLVFVIFYLARIPFILDGGVVSGVINYDVDVSDIGWALYVLIYQYTALVICTVVVNPKINRNKFHVVSRATFLRLIKLSLVILIVNLYNTFLIQDVNAPTLGSFFAILGSIFPINIALLIVTMLFLLGDELMVRKYLPYMMGVGLSVIVSVLYTGSKSGTLQVLLMLYLTSLIVRGPFIVRLKTILYLLPLGFMSLALYFLGNAFKFYRRGMLEFDQIFDKVINSSPNFDVVSFFAHTFSHRIGYLDYFIEKLALEIYRPVVTLSYYSMSLIDKITPGFDIFEKSYMSRALYVAREGMTYEGTNSEQITLFAESYILFGFFSILIYFLFLLSFRLALRYYKNVLSIKYAFYSFFVLQVFYDWIIGFGLDMLIGQSIYFFFAIVAVNWVAGDRKHHNKLRRIIGVGNGHKGE
jgi:hypothetical protein